LGTKSAPQLQIPQSLEAAAFRAIDKVLRNDPVLGPVTRQFISWTDSDDDFYEPSWELCPFLKISPYPAGSAWVTEMQHSADLMLRVQAATKGTDIVNLMNYWALVRGAIFPQTVAQANIVQLAILNANPDIQGGITKPEIRLNGFGVSEPDQEGLRVMIAEGTIRFGMLIPT
jgi:hypothetical protein